MSNEIMIKIRSDVDASGFRQTKDGLQDVEKAAKQTGDALDDIGTAGVVAKAGLHDVETASDKAGNQVGQLARRAEDLTSDLGKLDRAALMSKASLAVLASALADTDDAAQRIDIKKAMQKVQADLNATLKAQKILVDIQPVNEKIVIDVEPRTDPGDMAKSFIGKFGDAAMSAAAPMSKLLGNHVGITVGVAAGVAAAPVLASAIGSALAGAAGMGVLGAGVALAVKGDPGFQAAGQEAGKNFMKAIEGEAKVFAGPMRESLTILEHAGERVAHKWGDAFDSLSDDLVPFTKDVVASVERISDAFTNVAQEDGVLEGLGGTLRLLTDGIGDFVEVVADGGPKAAANLQLVAGATGDLLRFTGLTLNSLNELASNPWITGGLIADLREHYVATADATGTFKMHTKGAADEMEHAAEAAAGERSALMSLADELKAQADPVFAIIKAQDDLAQAQKDTAKATKEHGKNSAQAEAALQKQAVAALALEANIGKLGDSFNGKLTPSMRNTLKAAGLTDGAIGRLERQFREAKKAGDRFSGTYKARAVLDNYRGVSKYLAQMIRELQRYDGVWTATMVTNYIQRGKPGKAEYAGRASGGIGGAAASGGARSGLTLVGEEGPELAELAAGGRVWSNPDTRRMLAGGGGGGQGGTTVIQLVVDGRQIAEATVEPLRGMVNRQGGGNAQAFWGQGA